MFPFYVLLFKHQMLLNFFYSALKLSYSLNFFFKHFFIASCSSHTLSLYCYDLCVCRVICCFLFLFDAIKYRMLYVLMLVCVWQRGRDDSHDRGFFKFSRASSTTYKKVWLYIFMIWAINMLIKNIYILCCWNCRI